MSSQNLFEALKKSGVIGAEGEVSFTLNSISTRVCDSSVVGNVIQEWLKPFMESKNIKYRLPEGSQNFPDFYMHPERNDIDILEVKCFKTSPNFDIAAVQAYPRSLLEHPHRLDADYLIIEYQQTSHGLIKIKNIWLKKVWEICCPMDGHTIRMQVKNGVKTNIRPATFYGKNIKFKLFETRLAFATAIDGLVKNGDFPDIRKNWLKTVSEKYKTLTGHDL